MLLLIISGFLLCIAMVIFISAKAFSARARQLKLQHSIPSGAITYTDLNRPAESLFSPRYRLAGKPDYIVQTADGHIPVEFKSGHHTFPQKNHILQLAAYCQLLEDQFGEFVPYGALVYNNKSHTIAFDPKLRFELETTMKQMRTMLKQGKIQMNHHDPHRCAVCSMRSYCSEKLV